MAVELGLAECGLPKHRPGEQIGMLTNLRFGVKAAAGVVQIDDALSIEPSVLGCSQLIERAGRRVLRVAVEELRDARHAYRFYRVPGGDSETVRDSPHASGADGSSGDVFHRHSRTVSVCVRASMVAT